MEWFFVVVLWITKDEWTCIKNVEWRGKRQTWKNYLLLHLGIAGPVPKAVLQCWAWPLVMLGLILILVSWLRNEWCELCDPCAQLSSWPPLQTLQCPTPRGHGAGAWGWAITPCGASTPLPLLRPCWVHWQLLQLAYVGFALLTKPPKVKFTAN